MEDVRTGRMLVVGWLLYLASLIFNFNFYKMHPSSPKMWTWGAEEELEKWTPPMEKKTETKKQSNREQQNQLEASQIELAELLPQGLNGDQA